MASNHVERLAAIEAALSDASQGDFAEVGAALLKVFGYSSERTIPDQDGKLDTFLKQFPRLGLNGEPVSPDTLPTQDEARLRVHARSIHILFQYTDDDIPKQVAQGSFLADETFAYGHQRSFLFVSAELDEESYNRGHYASFTREINRRFPGIPAVVLFRTTSGKITLAFVHRRANKRNENRDVLGTVSLIREIDPVKTHRAHLDILRELSLVERLKWIDDHRDQRNFDGLLRAWLAALNTEELNHRFYGELLDWFDRAVQPEFTRFPTEENKVISAQEHVIRLITRMLFIWFIKEKGLVAPELFLEHQAAPLLKGYDRATGDSYYRVVLLNLFFATLNTEIDRRGFSTVSNATNRDFTRYRFRSEMADPDALRAHFAKTPFINGGLFDCLDSEEAKGKGGYRIDCFSDVDWHLLSVPNRLFFGSEGLIDLFERYKFTVEENTPLEVEVALDPELLGKVFEKLLAAYNPETKESARKQTGSYYTPRAVVDYMVDEALVASIVQKVVPEDADRTWWEDRLHYLLDYNDAEEIFLPDEANHVVRAIADLKVLDPAVGSGAFPMGVLHKLTLALRRLDPDNRLWRKLQEDKHVGQADRAIRTQQSEHDRAQQLEAISESFERYQGSDFGRKLYLIQNSIYGVDIQPVATQIAKLRFFISLAIEQVPDRNADNYGIQPLPNLETRFVTADALLSLGQATQIPLGGENRVTELNDELRENREKHFHAGVRREKLRLRREDSRLRGELAAELGKAGMSKSDAGKVAAWDPYDQNAHAEWFDAGYMFDAPEGFDVVLGNPPYVQLQRDEGRLGNLYRNAGYGTFARTGDIYQLFIERGLRLLAKNGLLAFVTSNSWLKAEYGKRTRRHLTNNATVLRLLEMGKDVFDSVIVDASVMIVRGGKSPDGGEAVDMDRLEDKAFPPDADKWNAFAAPGEGPWSILSSLEQSVMDKMHAVGTPLKEWDIAINYGVKTGLNDAFIIDNQTKDALITKDPKSAEIIKPVVRGRDIRRYHARWANLWLIDMHSGYGDVPAIRADDYPVVKAHLDGFYEQLAKRYDKGNTPYNLRNCAYHEEFKKEKLFWIDLTEEGRFAYNTGETYCLNSAYMMTGNSIKYLCAVLNSTLITWFMRNSALNSGMGVSRWVRFTVDRIPVPKIGSSREQRFIQLVDKLQVAYGSGTNTADIEATADSLVYELYGLTDEEVSAVARE